MRLIKVREKHSITIHPQAMEAAKFCQLLPLLFNQQHYQESLKYDFNSMITKAVLTEVNGGKVGDGFYAFSPIPLLVQAAPEIKKFVERVGCFKETEISPEEIEFQAWTSVFIRMKNSIDSTSNLYQIWKLLNECVPKHILKAYFGRDRITQDMFSQITDHSTSTIKHGNSKNKVVEEIVFDGYENLSSALKV